MSGTRSKIRRDDRGELNTYSSERLRKIRDHVHTVELSMRVKNVYVKCCLDTTNDCQCGDLCDRFGC